MKTRHILTYLIPALLLCLLTALGTTAFAESYYYNVSYVDADGSNKACGQAIQLTSSHTTIGDGTSTPSWYVVDGYVPYSNNIQVSGNVHLILMDDCNMMPTSSYAIRVNEGSSLTIYGQQNHTGILIANGSYGDAAIGSDSGHNAGAITINGGIITATGNGGGAGIGGGKGKKAEGITINNGIITATGNGGGAGIGSGNFTTASSTEHFAKNITINGGTITATGKDGGAGIGGGYQSSVSGITISGGTVTAQSTGTNPGSAIGGGYSALLNSENIKVTNTDMQLFAGASAGSGTTYQGSSTDRTPDLMGKVYASANMMPATNVPYVDSLGAPQTAAAATRIINSGLAITLGDGTQAESWYVVDSTIISGPITISGNVHLILKDGAGLTITVADNNNTIPAIKVVTGNNLTIYGQTAQTGKLTAAGGNYAAGIGTGMNETTGSITINGGDIIASSGYVGAGIGGGKGGNLVDLTINGGTILAQGGVGGGAGIGTGFPYNSSKKVYAKNIIINGGKITAIGGLGTGAGIGCSQNGYVENIIINGGEINASANTLSAGIGSSESGYLKGLTINDGKITAIGGSSAAGIGGGGGSYAENITIAGGTVNATGRSGAGIGGGISSYAKNITIAGGTVNATGVDGGAGIGGGENSYAENIEISGGSVTAECKIVVGTILGDAIGSGYGSPAATSSNIKLTNTSMCLYAGLTADDTLTAYPGSANDLAASMVGKHYATTNTPPLKNVPYIDADGSGKICPSAIVVESATAVTTLGDGTANPVWYAVDGTVNTDSITVSGNVHIILKDGASLTATATAEGTPGIRVEGTNTLTIYGQVGQTGKLTAVGADYTAGIGSDGKADSGAITINGGVISATGKQGGAGIGTGAVSGTTFTAKNITINRGHITATSNHSGAGIGGGSKANLDGLTINGGTVIATGGSSAAGIGGGFKGNAANIKITGGTVMAIGQCGAGIGGGGLSSAQANMGYAQNIEITGGNIVAISKPYHSYGAGNGIGSGLNGSASSNIVFNHSTMYLLVGANASSGSLIASSSNDITAGLAGKPYAETVTPEFNIPYIDANGEEQICPVALKVNSATAVITLGNGTAGESWYVVDGTVNTDSITVSGNVHIILKDGASLTATATAEGNPGIRVEGTNTLTIYGQSGQTGKLTANGAKNGAGIGGSSESNVSNIHIEGGIIVANGGSKGAGIGSGNQGSLDGLYINAGDITATGGEEAAGIGGAYLTTVSNIYISGGKVTAQGGSSAAGIGGGKEGIASKIYISGGNIITTGGGKGAGIGSGHKGTIDGLYISGGTIRTTGVEEGAGIGAAYKGTVNNIYISDGKITAQGGSDAAGIGGGKNSNSSGIYISGGNIVATGGSYGAGIGGGKDASASNITISSGDVTATGLAGAGIGGGAASSGSTDKGYAQNIEITGGSIVAISNPFLSYPAGAGIGSGGKGDASSNIIVGNGLAAYVGANEASAKPTVSKDADWTDDLQNDPYTRIEPAKLPPKTGDSTSPILWTSFGMLSIVLALAIVQKKKRVNQ